MTQLAGQPRGVRYQEAESELVVGEVHSIEASIGHGDTLEGHLGQSIRYVQIVQDAVYVTGANQDEKTVILRKIWVTRVCVKLQDGYDEGLDGVVQGVVTKLLDVGDGFECLYGGSPFDGHKKARWKGGHEGSRGGGLSQGWSGWMM